MKISPTTKLGWAACWLALVSIVVFAIGAMISLRLDGTPSWLRFVNVIAFAGGFAGGVCAVVSMLRQRERALLVFLTLIPALLVVMFVLFAE
ncbi:MAG: hypothetical protein WDA16_11635 [Candidatus Thermoplasmatota archaeon]